MFFDGIGIQHYFGIACLLFSIGIYGVISNVSNIIAYIISLEIVFLSLNLIFISIAKYIGNINGQSIVIFILAITAAEVSMILGIIIMHYKNYGNIELDSIRNLNELD